MCSLLRDKNEKTMWHYVYKSLTLWRKSLPFGEVGGA